MSVIADFTVPVGKFALKDTLPEVPTIKVEFERVVSHSQEWVMPFLWVYGDDLQTFDELTRRDPTVVSVTVTDEFSNVRLYDIRWSADIKRIINSIFDRDGSLVEASGSADRWNLSVRFASRDKLTELQSYFDESGEPFEVQQIYEQTRPRQPAFNLTPKQRKVVITGFEKGYFDIPRRVTLDELAGELEISTSAVSERLRRGIATLVESTLVIERRGQPDS